MVEVLDALQFQKKTLKKLFNTIKDGSCSLYLSSCKKLYHKVQDIERLDWTVNFRWFEGEKAQFRFVPYDWAFLLPPVPLKGELTH